MKPKHSYQDVFNLFFNPGELTEIRAFGCSGKGPWEGWARGTGAVFGYFNDADAFAEAAEKLEKVKPTGIYFTLNPVMPDFIGRSNNRLKAPTTKTKTTSDGNIQFIRWLPIDFDPLRDGGGSDLNTTKEELETAWSLRNSIHEDILKNKIGYKGIPAISGNGAHLLFRLPDLPNNEDNKNKVRLALSGIKSRWGNPLVDIDQKVFNPARIWKLYGTTARKCDHTEKRPQRVSYIQFDGEKCPTLNDIKVNENILDELAKHAPMENPYKPESGRPPNVFPIKRDYPAKRNYDDNGKFDVEKYLSHYGVAITKIKLPEAGKPFTYYEIDRCLFNPDHRREAGISHEESGTLRYHCFHNTCKGYSWHDARRVISGTDSLAPFMEGYRPSRLRPASSRKYDPAPQTHQPSYSGSAAHTIAYDAGPIHFIRANSKGRESLDPAAAADHFEAQLSPIYCTGGEKQQFFQYDPCGVWKPYSHGKLRRIIRSELADKAKPSWIKQIVEMLEFQCYKDQTEIDEDPMYINLINGMWGIEEQELLPHDPKYNSKLQLNLNYDTDAEAPIFTETINGIFKDDPLKIQTLQDFIGYCFFPKILFPGVLFAIGDGGNGKGVIEHVITKLFGAGAVSHTSLKDMNEPWGPYELYGKYVNTVSETSPEKCDMTGFKAISAGDPISAKIKYQVHPFIFHPFAKHYISMNQLPYMAEKTRSVFRRITVLEFEQNFTGANADPYLKEKLEDELDGIFIWALDGLYNVLENKCLTTPESVARAKERFKYKASPILTFAQEICVIDPNATASPPVLFRRYRQWCVDSGIKSALGKSSFYEEIKLTFKVHRIRPEGSTIELFKGIGLAATGKDCQC